MAVPKKVTTMLESGAFIATPILKKEVAELEKLLRQMQDALYEEDEDFAKAYLCAKAKKLGEFRVLAENASTISHRINEYCNGGCSKEELRRWIEILIEDLKEASKMLS